VTILAGATASTNWPAGCCDAILLRNVFHYLTEPAAMIRSLAASLKPGGRLAIVDFPPRPNKCNREYRCRLSCVCSRRRPVRS
jgi:SAM-dependent methyltransferase